MGFESLSTEELLTKLKQFIEKGRNDQTEAARIVEELTSRTRKAREESNKDQKPDE